MENGFFYRGVRIASLMPMTWGKKRKKRFLATLLGGLVAYGVRAHPLSNGPHRRYDAFWISHIFTFRIMSLRLRVQRSGAIGGAAFIDSFGWGAVGGMLLVRLAILPLELLSDSLRIA